MSELKRRQKKMKNALSLLVTVSAIGAATSTGALLFALCQRGESDFVGKAAFVFVIFAPAAGMFLTFVLHSKIGSPWLAAPMGAIACAATFGFTGYFAEWATELFRRFFSTATRSTGFGDLSIDTVRRGLEAEQVVEFASSMVTASLKKAHPVGTYNSGASRLRV